MNTRCTCEKYILALRQLRDNWLTVPSWLQNDVTCVRSPTEAEDFPSNLCVQTGSGAHPASCTMGTVAISPGLKHGRGVMLTTHPLLVPRLRKSRSYTSCHPNAPLWSVTGPLYLLTFTCICFTVIKRHTEMKDYRKVNLFLYHAKEMTLFQRS
jgi:hypothetical protein